MAPILTEDVCDSQRELLQLRESDWHGVMCVCLCVCVYLCVWGVGLGMRLQSKNKFTLKSNLLLG